MLSDMFQEHRALSCENCQPKPAGWKYNQHEGLLRGIDPRLVSIKGFESSKGTNHEKSWHQVWEKVCFFPSKEKTHIFWEKTVFLITEEKTGILEKKNYKFVGSWCARYVCIYIYTIDICALIFIAWHNITRCQQISPVSWANPNSIFGDIPTKLGSLCPDGYYPLLPGQSWTAHLRIAKTRVFHYWNTVLIPWWLELLLKFWSLDWYESCMGFIDAWEPAMNPKTHKTLCIDRNM